MRSRWIVFVAAGRRASRALLGQAADWYPSPWGPADQRGAANRITPEKVLEAKSLMTRGTVYQLGQVYEASMPLFGTRHFSLRIPQTYGPLGSNRHHVSRRGRQRRDRPGRHAVRRLGPYRRRRSLLQRQRPRATSRRPTGSTKLGVENVGPLVTRGVLVDVAAFKGVARLDGGYEITLADLRGALERQRTEVRSGDVVIVHTGWGSLWNVDNAAFGASAPGVGLDAAQYLVEREVVLVGSDTWSMEVVPNPNPELAFPVHQLLIPRNGIYIFENLRTEELARDRVYEFAFFFAPLKLKGATGSPANPLAIR